MIVIAAAVIIACFLIWLVDVVRAPDPMNTALKVIIGLLLVIYLANKAGLL